jgi:hypothetical protein
MIAELMVQAEHQTIPPVEVLHGSGVDALLWVRYQRHLFHRRFHFQLPWLLLN